MRDNVWSSGPCPGGISALSNGINWGTNDHNLNIRRSGTGNITGKPVFVGGANPRLSTATGSPPARPAKAQHPTEPTWASADRYGPPQPESAGSISLASNPDLVDEIAEVVMGSQGGRGLAFPANLPRPEQPVPERLIRMNELAKAGLWMPRPPTAELSAHSPMRDPQPRARDHRCTVERSQEHVGGPVPHVVSGVAVFGVAREPADVPSARGTMMEVAEIRDGRRLPAANICPDNGDAVPTKAPFQREKLRQACVAVGEGAPRRFGCVT